MGKHITRTGSGYYYARKKVSDHEMDYRCQKTYSKPPQRSKEEILQSSLYQELQNYSKAGIPLLFNGRPSNSLTIATYVREESDYMRDYQMDGNRKICGLGFDRIKRKKH